MKFRPFFRLRATERETTPAFGLKWINDGGVVICLGFRALRIRGNHGVMKYYANGATPYDLPRERPHRLIWRTDHRPWYRPEQRKAQ